MTTMHDEIRDLATNDPADKWGDAVTTMFAICDVLYAADEYIPPTWEYHAAPSFDETIQDLAENADGSTDYPTELIASLYDAGSITADDLRHAGNVLSRYTDILRHNGHSY